MAVGQTHPEPLLCVATSVCQCFCHLWGGVELSKKHLDDPGQLQVVVARHPMSEVPKVPRNLSSAGFTPVTQEDFSNNVAVGMFVCHFSFSGVRRGDVTGARRPTCFSQQMKRWGVGVRWSLTFVKNRSTA